MKLQVILRSRKRGILLALILFFLFVYIFVKLVFPGTDPFVRLVSYITNPYLILIDKFSNLILHWTGSPISIQNHNISLNGILIDGSTTKIMYKKATIFYILILWLTRTSIQRKIYFSSIYLVLSFLAASIYIVSAARLIAGDSNNTSIISSINGIVFFCMNTILLIWYLINEEPNSDSSLNISGISKLLERKLLDIIIILYGYSILLFSLGYFYFKLYIEFLLKTSQGILGILGYDSVVESELLIGNNGSISVYRTCLGFMTMFLFASMVYLTGNKHKRGWGYIMFGLLLLNLANIVRIVLLFMHIQKYGDFMLSLEVHDIYNYIIYFIVFILWVVWFERLMDPKITKRISLLFQRSKS